MAKRISFSNLQVIKHKRITERTISEFKNYLVDVWVGRGVDRNCDLFPLDRGELLRACKLLSEVMNMPLSIKLENELRMEHIPLHNGNKKTFEDIIKEKIGE